MSSKIQFRFQSSKAFDAITFSGLMIKLLELKRAIVEKLKLDRAHMDFDLAVSNAQTKEAYGDDNMMVPKNTSVVVRRVPATGQTGLLARLEAGKGRLVGRAARPIGDAAKADDAAVRGGNLTAGRPAASDAKRDAETDAILTNPVADGATLDEGGSTLARDPEGNVVVIACDTSRFDRLVQQGAGNAAGGMDASDVAAMTRDAPAHYLCRISEKLLDDAMMLPCCGESVSYAAALKALAGGRCPFCRAATSPDNLVPNKQLRTAVAQYTADWSRADKARRERLRDDALLRREAEDAPGTMLKRRGVDAELDLGGGEAVIEPAEDAPPAAAGDPSAGDDDDLGATSSRRRRAAEPASRGGGAGGGAGAAGGRAAARAPAPFQGGPMMAPPPFGAPPPFAPPPFGAAPFGRP
ncbi:zinc ion binding protein [Aureococcus anophagefferens]|nr:zinc ion binding protein [Aureococcus anophagefferens]